MPFQDYIGAAANPISSATGPQGLRPGQRQQWERSLGQRAGSQQQRPMPIAGGAAQQPPQQIQTPPISGPIGGQQNAQQNPVFQNPFQVGAPAPYSPEQEAQQQASNPFLNPDVQQGMTTGDAHLNQGATTLPEQLRPIGQPARFGSFGPRGRFLQQMFQRFNPFIRNFRNQRRAQRVGAPRQ